MWRKAWTISAVQQEFVKTRKYAKKKKKKRKLKKLKKKSVVYENYFFEPILIFFVHFLSVGRKGPFLCVPFPPHSPQNQQFHCQTFSVWSII